MVPPCISLELTRKPRDLRSQLPQFKQLLPLWPAAQIKCSAIVVTQMETRERRPTGCREGSLMPSHKHCSDFNLPIGNTLKYLPQRR